MKKLTVNDISELTGFDRRTVAKRLENLEPVNAASGSGRARYFKSTDALRLMYAEETIGKEKLQQKKLANEVEMSTIKLDQQKGELVEIDKVAEEVGNLFAVVRQNFLSVPSKAAQDLSHESDPKRIQDILFDMVNECLAELQKYEDTKTRASQTTKAKSKASAKAKSSRVGGRKSSSKS